MSSVRQVFHVREDENGNPVIVDGPAPAREVNDGWPMVSMNQFVRDTQLEHAVENDRAKGVPTEYVPSPKVKGVYRPVFRSARHQADWCAIHDLHNRDGVFSSERREF